MSCLKLCNCETRSEAPWKTFEARANKKLNPLGCTYKIKLNWILVLKYFHERSKIENIADIHIHTEWHKKKGTFEKLNKNWRNKKKILTEIEPLQLTF